MGIILITPLFGHCTLLCDVDKEYLEMCTFPLSTLVTTHWAVVNYRCISIEPVYTEMYGLLVYSCQYYVV